MSDVMSCQSCGRAITPGDRFCAGCGTTLVLPDATVVGTPVKDVGSSPTQCVRCGSAMGREDSFCPHCGASRPEPATMVSHVSLRNAQASQLIEATRGEFEVLQQLGTGAMGAVYLARDTALSRRVAIKLIAPNLLSDETMVSRFRLEAQTVASLRHPNIVNVHAVRQADDLHYFVMEFIDGPPLRSLIKEHAPLDIDVVQALLFQVGSALNHAHRAGGGVIHRDVKPANIMVDKEGDAFVTDFGISKIAEAKTGLTQTGATIGTPEYMSPEQCRGESLTGASDQYALGIVAYEMLCGHTPFTGTQYHIMVAHTSEHATPLREMRPDCPDHVADAVERMLAKAPEDRWPDLDSAVAAMGGRPLGYHDPTRAKIKALAGATQLHVPAVGSGSRPGASASTGTATSVTVTGLPSMLVTGQRFQLRASVKGEGDAQLSDDQVVWASTDPSIARVTGRFLEAVAPGSVSITASAGDVASSVLLTVSDPAPSRVLVRPASVTMQPGGRIALRAEVQDQGGQVMSGPVTWQSSDPSVATVTGGGEVHADRRGSATITARFGELIGTTQIAVEVAVQEGSASPPAPRDRPSQPRYAPASSSKPAWRRASVVAPVLLIGIAAGVAPIVMRGDGGAAAIADIRLTHASSGEVFTGRVELEPGGSLPLTGNAVDVDGTVVDVPVAWSSENEFVVTVDAAGMVRAVGEGSASLVVTSGSGRVVIPVTVTARVARVTIIDGNGSEAGDLSYRIGQTAVLRASVSGPGGAVLERDVAWRSLDPAVLVVESDGSVRAVSAGSTFIEAASGTVSDRRAVSVSEAAAAVPNPRQPPPTVRTQTPPSNGPPALPASPVLLQIRVGPTFASLYVDGELAGENLRSYTVSLLPGTHTIRLEHPRFQAFSTTLEIEPGRQPEPLQVTLGSN